MERRDIIEGFYEGILNSKDKMAPSYINNKNPKYLEIDGKFCGGILVIDYYREYSDIIFKTLINTNVNMNISIFYEKQDTYKTIKDLTYFIGNVGVELKSGNANREDIDIAAYTYNDAKYIRKEMQINNEELYFLYIYITLYSEELSELEYNIKKIEGLLESIGLQTRKANFRQEDVFFACMPTGTHTAVIKSASRRNVLTNGLVSTYPFITSSIFDEEGIFIGTNIYNNSLIFIDRYNSEKYKNANMCVFGTSGSRKIFLCKIVNIKTSTFRFTAICY